MTSLVRTAPTTMAALAVAAVTAFSVPPASADFMGAFGLFGAASQFTVYGNGVGNGFSDALSPGPLTINGTVGVNPSGDLQLYGATDASHAVVISGQIIYGNAVTTANFSESNAGTVSVNGATLSLSKGNTSQVTADINNAENAGAVAVNATLIGNAQTGLGNLYGAVKNLVSTANAPVASGADFNPSTNVVMYGNGGVNVADVGNFTLNSSDTLTLNGTASDYFVFNVAKAFTVQNSAQIVLGANVDPDHVLFNLLQTADGGGGQDVNIKDSAIGFGTILALDRNITFDPNSSGDSSWTGRLFGGGTGKSVTVASNALITDPTLAAKGTPEPPTAILLVTALLVGLGIRRLGAREEGSGGLQPAFASA